MLDLGAVRPGTTLYIPFATYDSNDPSASVTITGLATTDIECYKDGSVTQRASDSGYALLDTDGIDFDSTTGIHGISIDLADNTTAGFYEAGSQYWVVIASITVDAATINFIAATFRIGYPDAILNTTIATLASQTSFTLEEGPADDDALNGFSVIVHDVASAVQLAHGVVSDYTGSTLTATLAADPGIFTMAAGDNISFFVPALQPTVAGAREVVQTGDSFARLGAPAGASVSADIGTVDTVVDSIQTDTTAIVADTNELQGDWTNGGRLDLIIDAVVADTNELQGDWANGGRLDLILDARASQSSVDTVDSNVDAILVDTGTTIPGTIATVDSNVDAVLVDTGTTIPALIGTPAADLAADIAAVDSVVDNLNLGIIYGTAETGTLSTTQCTSDLTGYLDDELIGGVIVFTGGTADGQRADITDYAAASGLITFTGGITTAPVNGDTFKIV